MNARLVPSVPALWVALACGALGLGQPAAGQPIKMTVSAETPSIRMGDSATVICRLYDKDEKLVATPRDLNFVLEVRSRSGSATSLNVSIKAGENSWRVSVPVTDAGLVQVIPRNTRLLNRGTYLMVKPAPAASSHPTAPPAAAEHRPSAASDRHKSFGDKILDGLKAKGEDLAVQATEAVTTEAGNAVAGAVHGKPGLVLVASDERHLADGADAAAITVAIDETSAPPAKDVVVTLFSNAGSLSTPQRLTVKKELGFATAQLTSKTPGSILVSARPERGIELHGPTNLTVRFSPPITTAYAEFSPGSTSLMGRSSLFVELQDKTGRTTTTDEDCRVSLTILSGGGKVGTDVVTVRKGEYRSSAVVFMPNKCGTNSIRADAEDLVSSIAVLRVTLPVLLLCMSFLGGSVGGAVAFFSANARNSSTASKWRRIGIGVVTGFVFYWAVVFLNSSWIRIAPELALNPLSAVAVSVLGGFAGIKVFSTIWKSA